MLYIYSDTPFFNIFFFQDPATPVMEGIIDLHNYICFFLFFILTFVSWMLYRILWLFVPRRNLMFEMFEVPKNITWLDEIKFIHVILNHIDVLCHLVYKYVWHYRLRTLLAIRMFKNAFKNYYYFLARPSFMSLMISHYEGRHIYMFKVLILFIRIIRRRFFFLCKSKWLAKIKYLNSELLFFYLLLKDKCLVYFLRLYYFNFARTKRFYAFWRGRFYLNKSERVYSATGLHVYKESFIDSLNYSHGTLLEVVWTITPSIILIAIAIPSFALLYSIDEIVDPSVTLKVIGHQWYWSYEYSDYVNNDRNMIAFDSYMIGDNDLDFGHLRLLEVDNNVVLPTNTHIRILVTSTDVIHSWAIPSLGVKMDAIPGRLNQISMFIKRSGLFYGQCSEICGVNHAFMPIVIKAVSLEDYCKWLNFKYLG